MAESATLGTDFATRFPDSFARIAASHGVAEVDTVIRSLPVAVQATIVARLPAEQVVALLDTGDRDPAQWLVDARFEDAVTLLSRIPRERRLALINSVPDRERRRRLLRSQQYPSHSVGALVQDITFRLNADDQASDAIAALKSPGGRERGPLVVSDAVGRYVGLLDAWRLLTTDKVTGTLRNYLDEVSPLYPELPISAVRRDPAWHTHAWLPVVDRDNRVLGAVSRARVFGAAIETTDYASRDVMLDLLQEFVRAGEWLSEQLLVPGRRSR